MKLATTTGDFHSYTHSQTECLRFIREAGFRYADYSFGLDCAHRIGVPSGAEATANPRLAIL